MNTEDFKLSNYPEGYDIRKDYRNLRKEITIHFIWTLLEFITSVSIIMHSVISILRFQNIFVIPLMCGVVLFIVIIRAILIFIKGLRTLGKMRKRIKEMN